MGFVHVLVREFLFVFGKTDLSVLQVKISVVTVEEPVPNQNFTAESTRFNVEIAQRVTPLPNASLNVSVLVQLETSPINIDAHNWQAVEI